MKRYALNVLLGFDLFANTIFRGNPGETISGRCGRAAIEGKLWGQILAFLLDKIQRGHVERAMRHDAARAAAVQYLDGQVKQ